MPDNSNPQLQIAVCDDEQTDRQQAENLTSEIMVAEGLPCDLSCYESAACGSLGDCTAIIFISSNREMALRGYEVSAARYLAKPLREEQLREAAARAPVCFLPPLLPIPSSPSSWGTC